MIEDELVTDYTQPDHRLGSATFDSSRRYRYQLTRRWEGDYNPSPVTWIMLNPSTADALTDDATVRRCVAFAKRWGWGGIRVYNLYALRATNPRTMLHPGAIAQYTGVLNNDVIRVALCPPDGPVVAAWGTHGAWQGRGAEMLTLLDGLGVEPYCLGMTKNMQPRHPLRLAASTKPRRLASIAAVTPQRP